MVPRHALVAKLSAAGPFHRTANHLAFVVRRIDLEERVRIPVQELHHRALSVFNFTARVGDSGASHRKFAAKYKLPFTLLSDAGGRVRKLYGVKKTLSILPGRATFTIDRDGIVRHVFSSQSQPAKHVEEALRALSG
jgi:peroxiredoxin